MIGVEILGVVRVGDRVVLATRAGSERTIEVLAVDFIDFALSGPTPHAEIALWLADVAPNEIEVDRVLRVAP